MENKYGRDTELLLCSTLSNDIVANKTNENTVKTCYDNTKHWLKNAFCVTINNTSTGSEFSEMDEIIRKLTHFLKTIAGFSAMKNYKNTSREEFLEIFRYSRNELILGNYDSFLCFIICDNEGDTLEMNKAIKLMTKDREIQRKLKFFFIQEDDGPIYRDCAETCTINVSEYLKEIEKISEFFLVHQRLSINDRQGLIPRISETFPRFAHQEDILTMLASKCCYNTTQVQIHHLTKPVVFANFTEPPMTSQRRHSSGDDIMSVTSQKPIRE